MEVSSCLQGAGKVSCSVLDGFVHVQVKCSHSSGSVLYTLFRSLRLILLHLYIVVIPRGNVCLPGPRCSSLVSRSPLPNKMDRLYFIRQKSPLGLGERYSENNGHLH